MNPSISFYLNIIFYVRNRKVSGKTKRFQEKQIYKYCYLRFAKCYDKKLPLCAILTDMTKAFDCVHHETLLNKLHMYGIRGNVLDLIKSYLSDRK